MSALTDLFTSLANKIRTKLGTSTTYTPAQAVAAIDDVYDKGVTDTKVGNAGAGDVLSGKTFTNSSTVGETGTMTNNGAVSASLNTSTTSYTVPAGYHNGSGSVSITTQEKTVTAGTSAASVTPDSGKVLSKVTYNPTPSQTKSASPSTSAQTISPDSGKLLSSVSISAISPQRSAGVAATTSGRDSTGPYVYFPYGWHPNTNTTYGNYTRLTEAQAVAVANKQEKTVTSSRSAQTVTPDSNKLLSKVTVNALAPTGTYTASSRGASLDMGATSNYRYVNTNSVPNTNSGTYTPSSNGTALDMGATNTYRYVNTTNVYNAGKTAASFSACTVSNVNSGNSYSATITGVSSGVKLFVLIWINYTGNNFSSVSFSGATVSVTVRQEYTSSNNNAFECYILSAT